MDKLPTRMLRGLSSARFFWIIIGLFVLESVWLAISAVYPMVFDENVHFSIIQTYAHQWSPFFPTHAPYIDPSGAVSRDPSFLYRYLMSFPYRLIAALAHSQMLQVISLRFVDIALFGSALVLFRQLGLKCKLPLAVINLSLFFFILLPVVPLLAGQINYDDLIMPVTAGALLLAVSINERLSQPRLPITRSLWLLTLCLLGSLVQFEFLPIFGAIVLWLAWRVWRKVPVARFRPLLQRAWRKSTWQRKLGVTLPLLLAFGLFVNMYGVNLVRYHTLTPDCGQVLTRQQCAADGNWVRTQEALAHKAAVNADPLRFTAGWAYRMLVGLFFTSSGGAPKVPYLSVNPLPVVFVGAVAIFGFGVVLALIYSRTLFRTYTNLSLLALVSLLYVGILLLHNYGSYLSIGQKTAINGRYVLPVTVPALLIIVLAYREWLRTWQPRVMLGLLLAALLIISQGAGALTYIAVSNPDWYWQNRVSIDLNRAAQHVVKPLILDKKPLGSIRNL